MVRYAPANSFESPRFSGVRTFARLPNGRDLQNADAAVVGSPFDAYEMLALITMGTKEVG